MPSIEPASREQVLGFANKVRRFLGEPEIEALLPGSPRIFDQCVIATSVNCGCTMHLNGVLCFDEAEPSRIRALAKAVGCEMDSVDNYSTRPTSMRLRKCIDTTIVVPDEITEFARRFDAGQYPDLEI